MTDTPNTTDEARDANLFPELDEYRGDPLHPDLTHPTPAEVVAKLTGPERTERMLRLVRQADQIVDQALTEHLDRRTLAASCVLFSGGNDSTVLAHLMRHRTTHLVHANTTIGVEQTRQFVRDTAQQWGIPLIERTAPTTYRQLVLERGFPGPGMHYKMYQRLKERPLRQVRRELVQDSHRQRILFIAGRRRSESERRKHIPLHERDGAVIWASPLAMWTKLDLNTYRLWCAQHGQRVPVNQVSELLHMSGECLCGSFAKPRELDELRTWAPEVAAEIEQLERDVTAAGHKPPFNRWGHGQGRPPEKSGPLCSSCEWTLFEDAS